MHTHAYTQLWLVAMRSCTHTQILADIDSTQPESILCGLSSLRMQAKPKPCKTVLVSLVVCIWCIVCLCVTSVPVFPSVR